MDQMDPRIQFFFFLLGAVCFALAAFKSDWPPHWRMTHQRYSALGWLFFVIPFTYNAAVTGW